MIQSILSNLAIILLGHLLMSTLMNYRDRLSKNVVYICIVLLFSGVVVTMFYLPIEFEEYILDLRLIPLLFLALFRGWKITLPVLVIVSCWRLLLGGDGAVPGAIFGMILPTLFTLFFHQRFTSMGTIVKMLIIITVGWFISDFSIIFFLPNGLEIFQDIYITRYLSFLAFALIYSSFILLEYRNEHLKSKLQFLACHDALTSLLNRNRFMEIIEDKVREGKSNQYIAMIDIDHFKQLNDTYGHIAGDNVLVKIASIFKKYESEDLIIGRYGGEEFIFYQKASSSKEVIKTLEEIQHDIRTTSFQIDDNNTLTVTVSIGVAKIIEGSPLQDTIKLADQKLYLAKEQNRDKLVVSHNI